MPAASVEFVTIANQSWRLVQSFTTTCTNSMHDLLQEMQERLDSAEVHAAGSNEKMAEFVLEAENLRSQAEAAVKKTVRHCDFSGQYLYWTTPCWAVCPSSDDLKPECSPHLLRCWPAASGCTRFWWRSQGVLEQSIRNLEMELQVGLAQIAPCSRLAISNHQAIASEPWWPCVACRPACTEA